MPLRPLATALLLALSATAATPPLPELRTEPTTGGSIFYVRNVGSQPLTAWLIELVNYPGSSYSLWMDEIAARSLIAETAAHFDDATLTRLRASERTLAASKPVL